MKTFRHTEHALRIHAGDGALDALEGDLERLSVSRPAIFTGATLSRSPLLDLLRKSAGARVAGVFSGARTHTPLSGVIEASLSLHDMDADGIIVLGGGSAVVTARAASIFHAEGTDLDSLCTRRIDGQNMHSPRLMKRKIPMVVIPTTPNTAYVKAGAGIFDDVAQERKAVFDPQTRARSIFIAPQFQMSAPKALVVSASLDTLLLAVEGLLGAAGDPISDALLIHALRILSQHLPRLEEEDQPDLRGELTMAGILSGRGTDHAPAGATTALGHAIGANHRIDNGAAKAVLLPHFLRFNAAFAGPGLAKIGQALGIWQGGDLVERIADRFKDIFAVLGLPNRLASLGITEADLRAIAERAMKDWFILGNARPIRDADELVTVMADAL